MRRVTRALDELQADNAANLDRGAAVLDDFLDDHGELVAHRQVAARNQRQRHVAGIDAQAQGCSRLRQVFAVLRPEEVDRVALKIELHHVVFFVVVAENRAQQHAGGALAEMFAEIGAGKERGGVARGDDAALRDDHQRVGEPGDLVDLVADIEDRDARFGADTLQIGHDPRSPGVIERGERFVHQQDLRVRHQCPGNGDALALAAGQGFGHAPDQGFDAKHGDDLVEIRLAGPRGMAGGAIGDVAPDGHMREQAVVLEDVADLAAMGGEMDAALRIVHDATAIFDACAVGPGQAGDGAQKGGLAGARLAEDRGDAVSRLEGGFERERAGPDGDIDGELSHCGPSLPRAGGPRPIRRRGSRRWREPRRSRSAAARLRRPTGFAAASRSPATGSGSCPECWKRR